MRFLRVLSALVALPALAGCGYVHFGRLPATEMGPADGTATAYGNLLTEHKILKQELALSRREGDALRSALEHGTGERTPEVVKQLNDTARELAALRVSYAKLQAERASGATMTTAPRVAELEEKLATSLRNYTQLQEENARLRGDLDRTRIENTSLATQLKTAAAQNEETQAALAQLNTELLAQKEARARAEQATAALNTQLGLVLAAHQNRGQTSSGGSNGGSGESSSLELAKAPPAGSSAVADLRTNQTRVRNLGAGAPAAAPGTPRLHVVERGDTLESIALKYFNDRAAWPKIQAANRDRLGDGQPLPAGMRLVIPED